jgi:hypothetical protein
MHGPDDGLLISAFTIAMRHRRSRRRACCAFPANPRDTNSSDIHRSQDAAHFADA